MLAILLTLAISTPLHGHLTYACAGSSDALRNPWAVWTMIAALRERMQTVREFLQHVGAPAHGMTCNDRQTDAKTSPRAPDRPRRARRRGARERHRVRGGASRQISPVTSRSAMKVLVKNAPIPPQKAIAVQCRGCGSICEFERGDLKIDIPPGPHRFPYPPPPPYWQCPVCEHKNHGVP